MLDPINIVASFGALLAAIAAVWTIVEVKRQREATYKPRIVVPTTHLLIRQSGTSLKVFDEKQAKFEPGYGLKLQNLGFGSAVNVKIRWMIDYKEIVSRIKKLDDNSQFEIDNKGIIHIQSKTDLMPFGFASDQHERIEHRDYIQPESSGTEKCILEPPDLLINMIRVLLCLVWESQIKRDPRREIANLENICKLPVRIQINYTDISQKPHTIEYGMELVIHVVYMGQEFGEQWSDYLRCSIVCNLK